MNEDIEATAIPETLSDGSKVWNVLIENGDGGSVEILCVSEKGARRMASLLKDIFTEGGAA